MNYTVFINDESQKALFLKKKLSQILSDWNYVDNVDLTDYIFVIGGDGTFLKHFNDFKNKKIVAINAGNLGYYSFFNKSNLNTLKSKIANPRNFNHVLVLKICLDDKEYRCLNEVIIRCDRTFESSVYVKNVFLEKFKGSGILICTPMGSTAHNKNAHGAIMYNGLNAIQILELEPITQKRYMTLKSPLIVPSDFNVNLKSNAELENTKIIIDGKPIKINFKGNLKVSVINSDFQLFNPYDPKIYIKKLRDSFIREK
ncbi:NAD(+)/NADH kinase [Malacoplasma iowae]|uniref:NAD(+)/NADH kinase n=1 Tax=Malacoplasma iowae 695 TaxID=1048830 RepID=A0A6P1LH43_MALIO|nr:NAD(+)/NADH kinase [Malacoplasma iowae]VEU62846.1 inorganic polyphosphate/ATP-NAD kinase [Mycoplasmopsis fermentans]EGZ30795.1 hypothetical protein GUU_00362 [Malacoplasma iowae 695]QHG89415.1 NAD(+)/NADH kinase [Malacoplasma iowae 695]WPL35866.1 NAD(+)/NADH kinase [Malacoplasma iowae]WPL38806.1 NAD(+)/NADH kinase [Malacoplasma iowae]